jgi:hypothetical protein
MLPAESYSAGGTPAYSMTHDAGTQFSAKSHTPFFTIAFPDGLVAAAV